jgi:predicted ATPase
MFKEITLKNYRTHKLTTIQLKPVTLFIGKHSSGKTNFLDGIRHFCELVKSGRSNESVQLVLLEDCFSQRYRLATPGEPMGFSIGWENQHGEIDYEIELYDTENLTQKIGCRERIRIRVAELDTPKTVCCGYDSFTDRIALRTQLKSDVSLQDAEKKLCEAFFRDFESTLSYQLQPSFLKGSADKNQQAEDITAVKGLKISEFLGKEGVSLQNLLHQVKKLDEQTYARFIARMQSFESNFHGIRYDNTHDPPQYVWEFTSVGTEQGIEAFTSDVVSAGFLKFAAIALLESLETPPALILLEDIEHGISPSKVQRLMYWIWQTTALDQDGWFAQFILTSHSPSILREFHEHLDHVYTFKLEKRCFKSNVGSLSDKLDMFVKMGILDAEVEEDNGKRVVTIQRYRLPELWYSGAIG